MSRHQEKRRQGRGVHDFFSKLPPRELWRAIFRDFADIKDFYLEEEQKARLESMKPVRRGLFLVGWLLKSLFLKLTPIRQLLLLIAVFVLFLQNSEIQIGGSRIGIHMGELGGVILIFILMLELKDKLLARNELAEGRAIQMRLLPDPTPAIAGWEAWLYSKPANDVGGDLIDCIRFNDEHHALVLGDVSGKGLPAALLMVKLQATIRALFAETTRLADLGLQINRIFHRDGITRSFATLVVLNIRGRSGMIQMLNAGHTPPVFIRNGVPSPTAKGNPALGLMADTSYQVIDEVMQKGDILLVYSDGINESGNPQGECYGNDRLFSLISHPAAAHPADLGVLILEAVQSFRGEARAEDDQTLLILKYCGQ
jgi:sigma-B regulation protein RsbU (phosphoserine phosphatase)